MNTPKMGPAGHTVSSREGASDSLVDRMAQHSCASLFMGCGAGESTARAMETSPGSEALARPQSVRVAIKVRGKVLFISLGDVVAVQAKGKRVLLLRKASSYVLSESISVVAERLETQGFIRIHRSVLVNASCVQEIRPLSTGEYSLRVDGGQEYTVTRTYKKNLKSLAEFWIGTGALFPD